MELFEISFKKKYTKREIATYSEWVKQPATIFVRIGCKLKTQIRYIYFLNNLHVYYHIQQLEIIRRILTGGSRGRDRIW